MKRSLIALAPILCTLSIQLNLFGRAILRQEVHQQLTTVDGDYRSERSGFWNKDSTWARCIAGVWVTPAPPPDSGSGAITVRAGHTVTIRSTLVYDQVLVEDGGQVIVAAGVSHTLADGPGNDLTINGIWLNQGGTWAVLGGARWTVNDGGTFVQNTNAGISTPLSKGILSPASNFVYRGSSVLTPASAFSGRTYGNLTLESSAGSWACTASGGSPLAIEGSLIAGVGVKWNTGAFSGSITIKGKTHIDGEWSGTGSGNLGAHTFVGDFAISAGGRYQLATSGPVQGTVSFQGSVEIGGTIVTPSNRPVVFNGSIPQTISASTGIAFNCGFTASSALTVTAGTTVIAGPGTLMKVNSDLEVRGTLAAVDTTATLAVAGAGSRLHLEGATLSINKILISDGRDHTLTGTGELTGSSIVVDSSSSLTCDCNLRVKTGALIVLNGSLTLASGSTVNYSGAMTQRISPLSYSNLVVDNPAGAVLCGPTSVSGNLSVAAGFIDTREFTLTLGPLASSLEAGAPSVVGTLVTNRTLEGKVSENFAHLGLDLTSSAPMQGSATVVRVTGKTPSIRTRNPLPKWFEITYSGSGFDANLTFHYQPAEICGVQEANLRLFRSADNGVTWSIEGGEVDTSNHTIVIKGLHSSSWWAAAEVPSAPSLRMISPTSVTAGEESDILLEGADFTVGEMGLSFSGSGITVTSMSVISPTQIRAHIGTTPAAAAGFRDVRVTAAGGTAVLTAAFEIMPPANPAPMLLHVSPSFGARSQTIAVALTGRDLMSSQSVVSFGEGVEVISLQGNATTMTVLIAISTDASIGERPVKITNPRPGGGTSILPSGFTIVNPIPTVESAVPNGGIRGEKVCVDLKGTGFIVGVTSVDYGPGILVDSIVIFSSTLIRAYVSISTAASTGPRDLIVSNIEPGGGPATLVGGFRVANPPPRIVNIVPSSGMRGKPMAITVAGKDFIPGLTTVKFCKGISVDSVLVLSPTELMANIAVGRDVPCGWTHITVFNQGPGGGSSTLPEAIEIRNPPPKVIGLLPASGCLGEKVDITLMGADFFEGVSTVKLGSGVSLSSMTYDSTGTRIYLSFIISREIVSGMRDVVVSNCGPGGGSSVLPGSFEIKSPVPTLVAIHPAGGGKGETLDVSLSGTNFIAGLTTAKFGPGIAVNTVTVASPNDIKVNVTVAFDAIVGARSVAVTNPQPGGGTAQLPHVFNVEYVKPEITRVSPSIGFGGDRMMVTIEGANFVPGVTTIDFGDGVTVDSVQTVRSTEIRTNITIDSGAPPGPRDIVAWNPQPGGGSVRLPQAFNVQDPIPVITRVFPAAAHRGERVIVTIDGSNFLPGSAGVSFGPDIHVDSVTVQSSTRLQVLLAVADSATIGPITVLVENTRVRGAGARLLNGFTVLPDVTTLVANELIIIPDRVKLEEAFPNPFNPSTTIRFGLPEPCRVTVDVYTLHGMRAAQLLDGQCPIGYHEVKWFAGDCPSGVYFVRLRVESLESQKLLIRSKRIVLLR